jgi:hypothetical protein
MEVISMLFQSFTNRNELVAPYIDGFTTALTFINNDHSYIHQGARYFALSKFNLISGAIRKITFLTPSVLSGKFIHLRPQQLSTSADKVTLNIYENSSGNTVGTVISPNNRNRNSLNTSLSLVTDGQNVTTNGVLIDQYYIGGGTAVGGNVIGSTNGGEDEVILKPSTLYTFEIINNSASSNEISVKLRWYEENYGV